MRSARFGILTAFLMSAPALTAAEPKNELPVTGTVHAELASFDKLMTTFLPKHSIPGGSLAVGKDGHVVYERGFGYADRDANEAVQPDALFRIASISKPITAVAILQLIERGKLKADDKVFDILGLKAPTGDNVKFDERWKKVALLQLMHHTGGWDRGKSFDPMFRSTIIVEELGVKPPAGPDAVIRYMLRQPLDFDPGERFAYSNFGYCLLGRVIEKVTGHRYEEYVKKEVLAPLGIQRMRIGRTLLKDRAPGEVRYYTAKDATGTAILGPDLGKPVPQPYGAWNLEAMDSHGAWIASAADLVRFGSAFQVPAKCKVLSAQSIALMFAPPVGKVGHRPDGKPKAKYYACGWQVVQVGDGQRNVFHTGSLPGTSTILVCRHDGLTWAALFNTRDGVPGGVPSGAIDPLLHKAADEVKSWPGK